VPSRTFDPTTEDLHVMITTADYVRVLLAPVLAAICATEAPNVVFEFIEGGVRNADDLSRVYFMIAPRAFGHTLGKRIGNMALWQDDVVSIAAARNTTIPDGITPDAFRLLRQAALQRNPKMSEKLRRLLRPTSVLETGRVCTAAELAGAWRRIGSGRLRRAGAVQAGERMDPLACAEDCGTVLRQQASGDRRLLEPHRQWLRGHTWRQALLARAARHVVERARADV